MNPPHHQLFAFHHFSRVLLFASITLTCQAQVTTWSTQDIEARNAAVGFVQVREATLDVLRVECGRMMPGNSARVESIAKAWQARNRHYLEAASVWLDQYLSYTKSLGEMQHRAASVGISTALSKGVSESVRIHFRRQQPTTESCNQALRGYELEQLDFQKMGSNPGYEAFGEFSKTLLAFRQTPGFTVPPHIKADFRETPSFNAIASLDAAVAASERGDGQGMLTSYTHMAKYGDGQAAQSIGIAYLNGELTEKNLFQAYRWFYASWSLGNMEGVNGLGVLLRDGNGVNSNKSLAYGAFAIAQAGAASQAAHARASSNLERLQPTLSQQTRKETACMSLQAFDAALRSPVENQTPVEGRSISLPQRKLGQLSRVFSDVSLLECP